MKDKLNNGKDVRNATIKLDKTVETTRDYFKNFKGLPGVEGDYLGFERKTVAETAQNLLEIHRGEPVRAFYYNVSDSGNKYDATGTFKAFERRINIPQTGSLEGIFAGVNTDNMILDFIDKKIEIQKVVIGSQYISEIRNMPKEDDQ